VCSIIGYRGRAYAAPLLVESLGKMEYRGYDSVGIATMDNGKLLVKKGVGKVEQVSKTIDLKAMPGQIGIGHTRWATHGRLTNKNAHPHQGCSSEIAVVHNGIIENYEELKKELVASGHSFKSETDSEVATIIGISDKSDEAYDHFIRLPNLVSILYPLIEIIPLQLLAYYLAIWKNVDPDYPRNLAKSVTVK
jgi:glucosamine 6-phosphate synthetase-like amidotransferase/phosphosugar isomerase protein